MLLPNPVITLPLVMLFVGLPDRLPGRLVLASVDLALAAPVFAVVLADSIIFLKKPLFLALGAERPPKMPPDSAGSVDQSATGASG
jgi:hypothetical protein